MIRRKKDGKRRRKKGSKETNTTTTKATQQHAIRASTNSARTGSLTNVPLAKLILERASSQRAGA